MSRLGDPHMHAHSRRGIPLQMALLGDGAAPLSLCSAGGKRRLKVVLYSSRTNKFWYIGLIYAMGDILEKVQKVFLQLQDALYSAGGKKDLKLCFTPSRINKFWYIGMIYAMGDIFWDGMQRAKASTQCSLCELTEVWTTTFYTCMCHYNLVIAAKDRPFARIINEVIKWQKAEKDKENVDDPGAKGIAKGNKQGTDKRRKKAPTKLK